jgi:hypothetical protein
MKGDPNTLELIAGIGKIEKKTQTGEKKKRKRPEPINQGNIFNPDKIQYGNLPQDQEELL